MKKVLSGWMPAFRLFPILLIVGWFQGCSGSFSWPEHLKPLWQKSRTDTLRLGFMSDPGILLPLQEISAEAAILNDLIHRAPLRKKADGTFVGDLWSQWSCTEEAGRLVVEGTWNEARWHDGQAFSPADFDFTIETIRASATLSPFATLAAGVMAVEHSADQTRTKITFARNSRRYLEFLCLNIVPKHLLTGHSPSDYAWNPATLPVPIWKPVEAASGTKKLTGFSFRTWPCGLGPYRIAGLKNGFYLHLERVKPWTAEGTGAVPADTASVTAYQTILVRYYYGAEELVADMRNQALDWTLLPSEFAARLEELKMPGWNFQRQGNPGYTMLGFQTAKEPWSIREVREAIDIAIDRKQVVELMPYEGVTAGVPPLVPDISQAGLEMRVFDPAQSVALLEKSGLRDTDADGLRDWQGKPLVLKILVNEDNLLRKALAEALIPMLRKVGLKAEVEALDWTEMVEKRLASGSFDAFLLGFYAPLDGNWVNIWHSQPPVGEKLNFTGYGNEELDRLLEALDRAAPAERPASGPQQVARILYQNVPGSFLFSPREVTAVRQGLPAGNPGREWLIEAASATPKN